MKIGIWELVIILIIVIIIFGPKALPKLGEMFGQTLSKFKKGLKDDEEEIPEKTDITEEK